MLNVSRLAVAVLFAVAAQSAAQDPAIPNIMPVQGYLTDVVSGSPLPNGEYQLNFLFYDVETGGSPLFSIFQSGVQVQDGKFTTYVTLTPAQVDTDVKYLGLRVGGGQEMSPRIPFGTMLYTFHAQHALSATEAAHAASADTAIQATNGVPPGAVMFFALPSCPAGWSPYALAQGRAVMGTPAGGATEGTVGVALMDRENRVHSHMVDPPAVNSDSQLGTHTHAVDPPATNTDTVTHNHHWLSLGPRNGGWSWFSYAETGDFLEFTLSDGIHEDGSGMLPLATRGVAFLYTAKNAHSHVIDITPFASGTSSLTHSHLVDTPQATSSTANTGDVMPYLQLLACKKN